MLSVVVITKNEEALIDACLKSVSFADEIIIVDQGSTDKTIEIAKKFNAKVIKEESLDFSKRRNLGMEEAKGDWVLYLDADERVLAPLKEEIQGIIEQTEKSAYAISRKNIIFGEEVSYGPFSKDWVIRLFKRENFEKWVGEVHEHPEFKGNLGYTKNSFLHLTHRDIDHIVLKSLEWSKIDAKLRLNVNHPKMSSWRFLRILTTELFNQGVLRKGFFSGTVGIMDSILQAFSMFITYVRLWQLQQPEDLQKKYQKIDQKLIEQGFKY